QRQEQSAQNRFRQAARSHFAGEGLVTGARMSSGPDEEGQLFNRERTCCRAKPANQAARRPATGCPRSASFPPAAEAHTPSSSVHRKIWVRRAWQSPVGL